MKLELRRVRLGYGSETVLHDVKRVLEPGITLLKGSNGSGKSTLLRGLAGLLPIQSGEIFINGNAVDTMSAAYKALLGYLPPQLKLVTGKTGRELVEHFSRLKGVGEQDVARVLRLVLEAFELDAAVLLDRQPADYSSGQLRTFGLLLALLSNPPLLFLDEPLKALDPEHRLAAIDLLVRLNDGSRIMIVASHLFEGLDDVWNHVWELTHPPKTPAMAAGSAL